jgi:hypothetical protein
MSVANDEGLIGKTLLELAEKLKTVSAEITAARQEAAEAKTASSEVKAENSALKLQLDCQKDKKLGGFRFKHIGNELNFTANLDVIAIITAALSALETGRVHEVEAKLREAIKNRGKQNKHIKLADTSPAGWGFVVEYMGSDLAEDAEDERKI